VTPGNATAQTSDPGRAWQQFAHAGTIGSFPRLAAAIAAIRRGRGEGNVLLVEAGDTFSDDLLGNLTPRERRSSAQ